MTDPNVEAICAEHRRRAEHGLRKYGVTTERTDLSAADWLQHAKEEAMDLTVYLHVAKQHVAMCEAAIALALPLLEQDRATIVECHSSLEAGADGEPVPVPGTLEPGMATDAVAEYDAAIEACKRALAAPPATEAGDADPA